MRSVGHAARVIFAAFSARVLGMTDAASMGGAIHTGAGVARRAAFHERRREELATLQAEGLELPAEASNVEHISAAQLLEQVTEVGSNYIRC